MAEPVVLAGVYAGKPARLPDGTLSAIVKTAAQGPVWLGPEGLVGDQVANRRVHGGPEQALHHYPAEHYARWAQRFPEIAEKLVPGSIGENLSTRGLSEQNVHIGDVFAVGQVRIEVSQPRMPCGKIDARYGIEGLTEAVMTTGHAGWYYRVRQTGSFAAGDDFVRVERASGSLSLAEFWAVQQAHRPSAEQLQGAARAPGLSPKWRLRFEQRLNWLLANGAA